MSKNTTQTEITLTVGVAYQHSEALAQLFKMQGASLDFKLKINRLLKEINTELFAAMASVRDWSEKLNIASEEEKEATQAELNVQYKATLSKTITLKEGKISKSLLPAEDRLLMTYTVQRKDAATGATNYEQGDYVTLLASIYDDLIDENA